MRKGFVWKLFKPDNQNFLNNLKLGLDSLSLSKIKENILGEFLIMEEKKTYKMPKLEIVLISVKDDVITQTSTSLYGNGGINEGLEVNFGN